MKKTITVAAALCIALSLVGVAFVANPSEASTPIRWEYRCIRHHLAEGGTTAEHALGPYRVFHNDANALGREGWELVNAMHPSAHIVAGCFKRRLR
jgi:gentisate 1,2-dioxygenase